jgi:alpha-tubulin suppressor-like RCC1 family protein
MAIPGLVASSISAGGRHTCAIALDGQMSCWGANNFGQLGATADRHCGISDIPCTATALAVAVEERFRAVTAGNAFSCGITTTGQALCWGSNSRGELGTGTREQRKAPSEVAAP